jgi:hypothetical protein
MRTTQAAAASQHVLDLFRKAVSYRSPVADASILEQGATHVAPCLPASTVQPEDSAVVVSIMPAGSQPQMKCLAASAASHDNVSNSVTGSLPAAAHPVGRDGTAAHQAAVGSCITVDDAAAS